MRKGNGYSSAEEFFRNYTADETTDFYEFAKANNAIIDIEAACINVYNVIKTSEDSCVSREFEEFPHRLSKKLALQDFEKEKQSNPVFRNAKPYYELDELAETTVLYDGVWCRLEIAKTRISFSKEQLRQFLAGIDSKTLLETLPENILARESYDLLDRFIESEVPFRVEEILQMPLDEDIKDALVKFVKEDVRVMFDYDKFDQALLQEYKKLKQDH